MSALHVGPRWGLSLCIVIALHASAIAGGLWWAARTAPIPQTPIDALAIEMTLLPEAPTAPPQDLPPGPEQQQQQRSKTAPTTRTPPPVQPATVDDAPVVTEAVAETPAPEQAADDAEAADAPDDVAQTTAPPTVQSLSGTRYAAPQSHSGISQAGRVTWEGRLLGHLQRFKRYPPMAERLRWQGVTYVRFSVDAAGNVFNPRIGRDSGHTVLDEEALAVLQRAAPVPPPPAELGDGRIEVMVPVSFHLRPR